MRAIGRGKRFFVGCYRKCTWENETLFFGSIELLFIHEIFQILIKITTKIKVLKPFTLKIITGIPMFHKKTVG